jgi:hypothetical protein
MIRTGHPFARLAYALCGLIHATAPYFNHRDAAVCADLEDFADDVIAAARIARGFCW